MLCHHLGDIANSAENLQTLNLPALFAPIIIHKTNWKITAVFSLRMIQLPRDNLPTASRTHNQYGERILIQNASILENAIGDSRSAKEEKQ